MSDFDPTLPVAENVVRHQAAVIADLLVALEEVTEELSRWGMGDYHYGDQPQEPRVVEKVKRGRAAIAAAHQGEEGT